MVQHGCKIRRGKKTEAQASNELADLQWTKIFFRGVLMNIQAKAGVASLEKQIQIVQERARPNGLATHLGVLSSVELLI